MRRVMIGLIAVMMCACHGSGQSSGQPQWKVIKEFQVTGGSVQIAPKVLFTPKKIGLYRMTGLKALNPSEGRTNYRIN